MEYVLGIHWDLRPINDHLYATSYLGIVADHVTQFMTTMNPSTCGHFHTLCQKSTITEDWFIEHSVKVASVVTESKSYKALLGCDRRGNWNPECAANLSRILGSHNNSINPNFERVLWEY